MNDKIKKILKAILKGFLAILFLVVVAIIVLPLWIGPVATSVANSVTPDIIKCGFNLGEFSFSQYSGKLHVGALSIANPEGFSKENCLEISSFDVDVAMKTVLDKKIYIEDVVIDGLKVSTTLTAENFRTIAKNASQGQDAAAAATPAETVAAEKNDTVATEMPAEKQSKDGVRVVIKKLVLKNATIKINGVSIPLLEITLKDIGEDKEEGASLMDVVNAVWTQIFAAASSVGKALGDLGAGALDVGAGAVDAASGAVKDLGESAASAIKGLFKKGK
jgi:hypothetical protein